MSKLNDLTGQRFGRLTVQALAGRDKGGSAKWNCLCDCGKVAVVTAYSLKRGSTSSCGCVSRELSRERLTIHGGKGTRIYNVWRAIKKRCTNQMSGSYKDYGGRGITVCDEWLNSFETFRDWALANGYRDDLTIDRIDNDGPYCPENCRWVTMKQQGNNRRSNRVISYNGKSHTLAQWAEITGIKTCTLYKRIKRGWSVEQALTKK